MATIVLDVPDELKGLETALQGVVDAAHAQMARARTRGPAEYSTFESDISAALLGVERSVHAATLAALDMDAPRLMINGQLHVRAMRARSTFYTQAGGVEVERTLYRPSGKRNAPVVDIVALRTGAVEKVWLPGTARVMAHLLQQGTPREAEATAKRMGRLPYSHTSFHNVGQAVGRLFVGSRERIEEALIERHEIPSNARSVSVSLDRVSVPMEEPRTRAVGRPRKGDAKRPIEVVYRMAYCGTVTLHDPEGEAIHTIRYGVMAGGDARQLCMGMADDVLHLLARKPELRVALLCDGAPEMWNLLDAEFDDESFGSRAIRRLVDFWHLIEKLSLATRVMFPDASTQQQTVARWRMTLLNKSEAANEIREEIAASGKEHVKIGEARPAHDAMTYLANHFHRMNYAGARRLQLPIGSGNVEATCKSLFTVRLKRSGARWKHDTGEHVVALRAIALSDRWDQAMDLTLAAPKLSLRRAVA